MALIMWVRSRCYCRCTFSNFHQIYNLEDARAPPLALNPSIFLNGSHPFDHVQRNSDWLNVWTIDDRTRAALHAPTSKNWSLQFTYPFNSSFTPMSNSNFFGDPSMFIQLFRYWSPSDVLRVLSYRHRVSRALTNNWLRILIEKQTSRLLRRIGR